MRCRFTKYMGTRERPERVPQQRVRHLSSQGAQSGQALRVGTDGIGLAPIGVVRADRTLGHKSLRRVQCGEPMLAKLC